MSQCLRAGSFKEPAAEGHVQMELYCVVLYCGRVPAANAPGCILAEGLPYKPWSLVVPICITRCLHQRP